MNDAAHFAGFPPLACLVLRGEKAPKAKIEHGTVGDAAVERGTGGRFVVGITEVVLDGSMSAFACSIPLLRAPCDREKSESDDPVGLQTRLGSAAMLDDIG